MPLDLYLATDRGRYPAYRPGEALGLVLQANRDAYAYCWLRTGRGRVLPVFPVRAEDTGLLQGGQTLRLVGDGRPGVVAGPELDEAQLRCMAAPEPLEPDLAQAFVDSWAKQFAGWGVDYVKIDGVGTSDIPDIQAWSDALKNTGRPIHLELSNSLAISAAGTWQDRPACPGA